MCPKVTAAIHESIFSPYKVTLETLSLIIFHSTLKGIVLLPSAEALGGFDDYDLFTSFLEERKANWEYKKK